jgi:hypothetical protein
MHPAHRAGAGARVAHTPHVDARSPPERAVLGTRELADQVQQRSS